jgi:methyl-accepting chemotaxis protein
MEEAKKQLQKVHFDSNAFIDLEMKGLGDATEQQLFDLFEKLMEDVEEFSESLEEDVNTLQEAVDTADDILLNELRQHAERLNVVKESVDEVERNFERASEGAVRIGSRLAATERERSRIETAMLTLDLVTAFEAIPVTGTVQGNSDIAHYSAYIALKDETHYVVQYIAYHIIFH